MRIYLATWMEEPAQAAALTKIGGSLRLLSYHFLIKKKDHGELLTRYVKTGLVK